MSQCVGKSGWRGSEGEDVLSSLMVVHFGEEFGYVENVVCCGSLD